MNLYWPMYKNLESELLELSNYIHFSDNQESVYSPHISDLLIRTASEIEAIAKELYQRTGGNMNPDDGNGNTRTLYFDSDCIQHLDLQWKITKKAVNVVSPVFYFSKPENLVFLPLKNCNKQGSGRWKKAYQAVKHDRVKEMQAGNIGNLIRAMAALYLLNIYYRDESFEGGTIVAGEPFDARLGSEVFAISVAHAEECSVKDEMSDDGIAENVKKELDSCAYIQKYTEEAFSEIHKDMLESNARAVEFVMQSREIAEYLGTHPDYKIDGLVGLATDAGGIDLLRRAVHKMGFGKSLSNAKLEIVLNKDQQIYPVLGKENS